VFLNKTYNKVTITPPATGSTLTIADGKTLTDNASLTLAGVDGKTLTVNNTATLTGPDGAVLTYPATDTLLGLAATQSPLNKNLTAASSGSKVTLLNSQDPLGAFTGNGTDQTVYSFSIPANTVQAGKGIRLTYHGLNNNAAAITYKIVLGATTLFTINTAAAANNTRIGVEIFNNSGVQNAQTATI
jgi:hypothetical protein